ncbi:protein phosphatase [Sanguibacter gelidistatuariae]|uniref:Protein phosphatase n=1 Tax=Sanguibacter gelidistatuariae TaxID=1814289 RepID=A0A1G6WYI1_9MICO|nr:protein phosphatase 2C domain-containing protein [Sanguibacter gelidistatuariae]SDD70891.1 protein phosphatase [Sanguibacter gelidistatuariae]
MDQRHPLPTLRWGATTHTGRRRSVNEDAFHAERGVYFVADGMGGHEAGARASATAVAVLCSIGEAENASEDDLYAVVSDAHRAVSRIATQPGRNAGTTMSGAVVVRRDGVPSWLIANVGDSRTYRFYEGKLAQVTTDHSLVQEMLAAGEVSPEEARTYARRHVITRALGGMVEPEPDCWYLPIVPGERLMICSDGLTEEVSADVIARVLRDQPHPQLAADQLVNSALLAGGRDNITVLVVDVARPPGVARPAISGVAAAGDMVHHGRESSARTA